MTNEELDKRIEFIIQQQVRLVTNQEKADERMTRLEDIVGRLATASLERFENPEDKVTAPKSRSAVIVFHEQVHWSHTLRRTDRQVDSGGRASVRIWTQRGAV
jgi:hypothetical protein